MARPDTQNIYNDPLFFTEYSKLARSQRGLDGAPEWPSLRQLILSTPTPTPSPLKGQSILDLGCGYGWFCRWAAEAGATSVHGIDVSERMIAKAREMGEDTTTPTTKNKISYIISDLETIQLSSLENLLPVGDGQPHENENENSNDITTTTTTTSQPILYDVIYSSLTFHYLKNLGSLFRQIRTYLRPGTGRFVFSVEHPVYMAPVDPAPAWMPVPTGTTGPDAAGSSSSSSKTAGDGRVVWPLNSYSDEGPRETDWLGVKGVRKQHRTVETYVSLLLECGFVLTALREWVPSVEDVEAHPEWRDERHRPYFLLVRAEVVGGV
ncbi:hypothetical protein FQN50_009028 [Emmonsiellopsis sp. PD_5]|nr:hypothetical protein FQN50_009028 [Emmonsiellopsis sp. PD_5]